MIRDTKSSHLRGGQRGPGPSDQRHTSTSQTSRWQTLSKDLSKDFLTVGCDKEMQPCCAFSHAVTEALHAVCTGYTARVIVPSGSM